MYTERVLDKQAQLKGLVSAAVDRENSVNRLQRYWCVYVCA